VTLRNDAGAALDVGRMVCARLDGLMTRAGFTAGQIGTSLTEVNVMYCAEAQEFRQQFPVVAAEIDVTDCEDACTDLSISIEPGRTPRLLEAHLEGMQLMSLLGVVGPGERASQDVDWQSLPLPGALDRLAGLLRDVFDSAHDVEHEVD